MAPEKTDSMGVSNIRSVEDLGVGDDAAFETIQASGLLDISKAKDRQVCRRIDFFLLPLMMGTYLVQFLDKSCISYAALWGMEEDAHLEGSQYSWLTTIFYLGYLVGEFPMNYLFQKIHITRVCGVLIFLWGAVLLCMTAANDFQGLMASRFFLGLLESGVSPCFVLLTAMFYKRSEQPLRTGFWFSMNGLAQIIGGPVAYGIGLIHNDVPSWKFPFIIFGAITVVWAIVFLFFAPPNPMKAKWLSPQEKVIAVERVAQNETGVDNKKFKWYQVREAFTDMKVWVLVLFTIASNIPNGGLIAFGPLIINGFGFSKLGTTLLGMPMGAAQVIALWISGWLAGYFKNCRLIVMAGGLGVAIISAAMIYAIPSEYSVARLMGYYLLPGFCVTYVLSLGLIQANIAGRTKKNIVTATMFVSYCIGNLIGPQLFFDSEAPRYQSGFISMLVCFCIEFLLVILMYILYSRENHKASTFRIPTCCRDALQEGETHSQEAIRTLGLSDLTDVSAHAVIIYGPLKY
ncbi:MAG: hypothetical protein M1834_002363 [Cirrosporium novae-zelandiae]|nr:MAG: hypothetical protein M1834_002363 [Cirrosporium novae-zelandiae]